MSKGAMIEGPYRYALWRDAGGKGDGTLLWVMLNPSTADAETDDPTIRKITKFTRRWGFAQLVVVNMFAWRATEPSEVVTRLADGEDVVGPDNDLIIRESASRADEIVFAWGAHPWAGPRAHRVEDLVRCAVSVPFWCLGVSTTCGEPLHPLFRRDAQARLPYWPCNRNAFSQRVDAADPRGREKSEGT